MQENPADALYWPALNWSYNARVLKVSRPSDTSFGKAQETELMHVQFAYAAIGQSSEGEASIGKAMAVAVPKSSTALVGMSQGCRLGPARARVVQDNEMLASAAHGEHRLVPPYVDVAAGTQRCVQRPWRGVPAATPFLVASFRWGAGPAGGVDSPGVWPAAQAVTGIGAKILAGDGVRARRVMGSALGAGRHRVFWRAGVSLAGKRRKAWFVRYGEVRFRMPARLAAPTIPGAVAVPGAVVRRAGSSGTLEAPDAIAKPHAAAAHAMVGGDESGSQGGAVTLHDFRDGSRAVLDVVKV